MAEEDLFFSAAAEERQSDGDAVEAAAADYSVACSAGVSFVDVGIESAGFHKTRCLGDVAAVQNSQQVSLAHDGFMPVSPRLAGMEKG
jgi:hypothetical protein